MTILRDVEYVPGGGPSRALDLYLPDSTDAPLPLVIFIHGGAFLFGDKREVDTAPFTDAGFAFASINYRLSGEAVFPAQVEDCKAAVRFLRQNAARFHLDADRFGAWGDSAGGYLVAFLGTAGYAHQFDVGSDLDASSRVQAVVDWYGPTDLLTMDAPMEPEETLPQGARDIHFGPASPAAKLLGQPIESDAQLAREASPLTYVAAGAPPFLIVHGDRDTIIGLQQSRALSERLQAVGADATLVVLKDTGHGDSAFQQPEEKRRICDFFRKHLTG